MKFNLRSRFPIQCAFAAFLLVLTVSAGRAQETGPEEAAEALSERHQKWVEQEVVYIISDVERKAFLSLQTEKLRDQFVEAFWLQRDPTPATAANEYQEEHYRRLSYANTWFGNRKTQDGWRSDRGRIYILLGEPQEKSKYTGQNDIRDLEIWFYDSQGRIPTIPFFRLLFYQRSYAQDFVLYNPIQDGPEELAMQIAPTREQALAYLYERAGRDVWEAAQSYIPTETLSRGWSPESDVLLSKVENLHNTLVDSSWAENFLVTRGRVTARLALRRAQLSLRHQVLFNTGREAFLHVSLEIRPEDLQVGEIDGRHFSVFDVKTIVEDRATQREVLNRQDHWEESFDFRDGRVVARPIAFQQVLPLVPGDYRVLWILDDLITETFDFREFEVSVPPSRIKAPFLTEPLLAGKYERLPPDSANEIRPYRVASLHYHPELSGRYNRGDNLSLFFQFLYPVEGGAPSLPEVLFEIDVLPREGSEGQKLEIRQAAGPDQLSPLGILFVHRQIPVTQLRPGSYDLKVRAVSGGELLGERTTSFSYAGEEVLVRSRPTVFVSTPDRLSSSYYLFRARQLQDMDRREEAVQELSRAVEKDPANELLRKRLDELKDELRQTQQP